MAGQAIAERHQGWAGRLPEDGAALRSFVASLNMDDLVSLLAHCGSLSLNAVQRPGAFGQERLVHANALAQAMPHNISRYWQPTVENYPGRVGKERILDAVRDGLGENAARQIAGLKKQAMAARAEQLLAGKNWLPSIFGSSDPGENRSEG